MRLDVTDAANADNDGVIHPPFFVRYANGGVVAFKSVEQALRKVSATHIPVITGVWDRAGLPMHYEEADGLLILTMSSVKREASALRGVLVQRLNEDGARDLDEMDDQAIVELAYDRLRLMSTGELWQQALSPPYLGPG